VQHRRAALGGLRGGLKQFGLVLGGGQMAGHRGFHRRVALALPVERVGLSLDHAHHRAAFRREVAPVRSVFDQMRGVVGAQRRLGGDHVLFRTALVTVEITFLIASAASASLAS
jgi:hypothetical protein